MANSAAMTEEEIGNQLTTNDTPGHQASQGLQGHSYTTPQHCGLMHTGGARKRLENKFIEGNGQHSANNNSDGERNDNFGPLFGYPNTSALAGDAGLLHTPEARHNSCFVPSFPGNGNYGSTIPSGSGHSNNSYLRSLHPNGAGPQHQGQNDLQRLMLSITEMIQGMEERMDHKLKEMEERTFQRLKNYMDEQFAELQKDMSLQKCAEKTSRLQGRADSDLQQYIREAEADAANSGEKPLRFVYNPSNNITNISSCQENIEVSQAIMNYMEIKYPGKFTTEQVKDGIARRYRSWKQAEQVANKGRQQLYLNKNRKRNRTAAKAGNRLDTLQKYAADSDMLRNLSSEQTTQLTAVLRSDMMTSDSSDEDDTGTKYYKQRKPNFRSVTCNTLLSELDNVGDHRRPQRSKEQLRKRILLTEPKRGQRPEDLYKTQRWAFITT